MLSFELFLLLISAYKLFFSKKICKYFSKTSYIFRYTRYTSYSLFSTSPLLQGISSCLTALNLSLVEVNGFEPMTPSLQS